MFGCQLARRSSALALLAAAVLVFACPLGRAQTLEEEKKPVAGTGVMKDSALARVPADAAFYFSSLRNKEQIEQFTKSNAYRALQKNQYFKIAQSAILAKMEEPPLSVLLENKDFKEVADLLTGAASEEIFVYGGKGFVELFGLMNAIQDSSRKAAFQTLEKGVGGLVDPDAAMASPREALRALVKGREKIRVPELVIGMKTKDAKKFDPHLKKLKELLDNVAQQNDKLKDKVKLENGLLTLEVTGEVFELDKLDLTQIEEKKDEFKDLLDHLKKMTVSVSVGVKDDYLLLAIGGSVKDLDKLGKGKVLAERQELEPLAKHAKEKITSVSYVSKAVLDAALAAPNWEDIAAGLRGMVDKSLGKKEDKEQKDLAKAINKDIDGLAAELKKWYRGYGAWMAYSMMTREGYEGFAYDMGKRDNLARVKTNLFDHVGGDPVAAMAFGFPVDGTTYAMLTKYIKAFYGHGESGFLASEVDGEIKDQYKKNRDAVLPIIKKVDETISKQLIPSMKGNAGLGVVLDAKLKSKKWHAAMKEYEKPLPMVEFAALVGIEDGEKFTTAMKEFRASLNEMYAKVRELTGAPGLPDVKLEDPTKSDGKNGTLYAWPFPPAFLGVDDQVQLITGVGKKVSVLTMSKAHADRLMGESKLKLDSGPLSVKRDLIGGGYVNFHGVADFVVTWATAAPDLVPADDPNAKQIKQEVTARAKDVKEFVTIFRCLQDYQSATYLESGKLVTHVRLRYKDMEASPEPPK